MTRLEIRSVGRRALIPAMVLVATLAGSTAPQTPRSPFESPLAPAPANKIDELVFARLARLGVEPARLSSDAVFVRRVYLDTIGTLPTADETRAFLANPDPAKRSQLIDRLLTREEFADYWAMKWCDLLRVKSEFPINLWPNAVQAYHHWIRTAVRDNLPYDRFVRALLTGSGSSVRVPQVNFYRAVQSREPQSLAQAAALTFMGARAERWPGDRLAAMAAFFSQVGYKSTGEWKEEIIFFDPNRPWTGGTAARLRTVVCPDETTVRLGPDQDPREAFAAWLTAPNNPWFARAIVNRLWAWLLGRGIVHEADDLRPDNPPSDPALLALLERELVASRYDLKQTYRLILNSTTYQLSSLPRNAQAGGEADFSHYLMRPLDAEVLIDAISQITGTTEQYSSPIPEPYTFIPGDQRSIALADGSITSAFLDTFGRSPRDTGLEAERNTRPTAAERLYLLNSSQVQRKLEQSATLQALIQARGDAVALINSLYLTILSRFPTEDEVKAITAYTQTAPGNRRVVALDVAWALINSAEFLYRH
jgi:hypothetical protein